MTPTNFLAPGNYLQGRYQITRLLGQGGFGAVYLAQDLRLGGRAVAVKENFDSSPDAQAQFKIEADMLAVLSHPSLPRVTDHFIEASGRWYLVMDYIEGDDLETLVTRSGKLSEQHALPWIEQVCEALAYLHAQPRPIIHRDIKPGNIRIRSDGRAMLVDFGIAKLYDPNRKTQMGARAVSPGYSPLEQYGRALTDARSDVYALGATMYFVFTGTPPPEAPDLVTRAAQLHAPRLHNPALGAPIEQAILKAMELDPNARFQTADALRQALHAPALPISTTDAIICPRCRGVNRSIARVCRHCGTRFGSTPLPLPQSRITPPQSVVPSTPPPQKPTSAPVPAPKPVAAPLSTPPQPAPKPVPPRTQDVSLARYVMTILLIGFLAGLARSIWRSYMYDPIIGPAALSMPGTLAFLLLRRPGAALFTDAITLYFFGVTDLTVLIAHALTMEIIFALGKYRNVGFWIVLTAPVLALLAFLFIVGFGNDTVAPFFGAALGGFAAFIIAKIFKR